MFGFFKRLPEYNVSEKHDEGSEPKKDKRFLIVMIVFASAIVLTIIRAFFDSNVAAQFHKLKFSIFDGIMLLASAGGYYFIKRRGDK
jgi:hypothetical protein